MDVVIAVDCSTSRTLGSLKNTVNNALILLDYRLHSIIPYFTAIREQRCLDDSLRKPIDRACSVNVIFSISRVHYNPRNKEQDIHENQRFPTANEFGNNAGQRTADKLEHKRKTY